MEREGQQKTWAAPGSGVTTIWFEGDTSRAKSFYVRTLGRVLGSLQRCHFKPALELQFPVLVRGSRTEALLTDVMPRPVAARIAFARLRLSWSSLLEFAYRHGNRVSRLLMWLLGFAGSQEVTISRNRAHCDFPAHWYMLAPIYFRKFEFAVSECEFDFVLFTTATCYVRTDLLKCRLRSVKPVRFYGGHIRELGHPFVTGNSIVMSRDVLERVVALRPYYRIDVPDDVALARIVRDFDLADLTEWPTEHLPFGAEIPSDLSADWRSRHIVRCKGEPVSRDSEPVVRVMLELHRFITTANSR